MGRHLEPPIGFDLETTDTDPREAHVVTGDATCRPRTSTASRASVRAA